MSLYFFSKLEEGSASTAIGAHRSLPLCAYAVSNKALIVGEDGETVATVQRAASNVAALAWHPFQPVLAIGWQDGNMSIWNEAGPEPNHSGSQQHESAGVVALCWTDGNVLASVSKTGAAVFWMYEAPKLGVIHTVKCDTVAVIRTLIGLHGTDDKPADEPLFISTSGNHEAIMLDDNAKAHGAFSIDTDSTIMSILWAPDSRTLLVLSNTSTVYVYHLAPDNVAHLQSKQRLSIGPHADAASAQMTWAYPGIAAISSGDETIRFYNVAEDAIYAVTLPELTDVPQATGVAQQRISALASCRRKHLMAAGTRTGRVVVWNFSGTSKSEDADDWQVVTTMDAPHRYAVDRLQFTSKGTMLMSQAAITSLLQETTRLRANGHGAVAVQTAPDSAVIIANSGTSFTLRNGTRIKALDVAMPQAVVHTGRHLEVYSLTESTGMVTQLQAVELASSVIAVHPDGILSFKDGKVSLQNLQLHVLQAVGFNDSEGVPTLINVMGDFCCIVTNTNKLKVCRISTRNLKTVGPARNLDVPDTAPTGNFVVSVAKVNAKGKKVAFLRRPAAGGMPDPNVYVLDLDTDVVSAFDCGAGLGQAPTDICWNRPSSLGSPAGPSDVECLLLSAETKPLKASGDDAGSGAGEASLLKGGEEGAEAGELSGSSEQRKLCTFFASDMGLKLHNSEVMGKDVVCLAGCAIPNLLLCTASGPNPNDHKILQHRIRDFEGMQSDDAKLRDALVQFAYCSSIGNMDEAYKNVKTIKDASVWQNLARMCVSSGRMDVAEVCLANMRDAVAARELREARKEPEPEVARAALAMSLGMLDEAEKLLRQAKRNDLLTELYAACGKWDVATKHAEAHDRIRIYPTHYRHAQHLEATGEHEEALRLYQKARCYGNEGPRILFMWNRIDELRANVARSDDKELIKWWAQYLESTGDTSEAITQFARIEDGFNQVRLLCMKQPPDIDKAIELVSDPALPSARGAAFFIARHFEEQRNVQQAMSFYNTAGAFKNALRLAKDNDMTADIVSISLKCGDRHVALESGTFFEERGMYDKAAQLYQKGGDSQRAIDVCIKGGLYDELHRISESLDAAAEPETFIAMAEHFIVSGHHAKAVQMLVFGKAFNEALQLCMDNNVPLTEEMAEAMTLPKTNSQEDEEYRISLLKKIARVAKAQESWYLACKKYTQAGERVKAIKSLLRSGDTEKIVFFANHSRNAEIYVLVANYLQSQNWQTDTAVYKNIVTFYTKAKAFDELAGFYEACAQLQVDEYRDYDKALTTLREAQKALDKGEAAQDRKDNMRRRAELVEQFVNARSMIRPGQASPETVDMCNDLLARADPTHMDSPLLEQAVRVGDIYALLVEYHDKLGQAMEAFALIQRMQQQQIQLTYFLEPSLVEKICKAAGHDPAEFNQAPAAPPAPAADDDIVDDEVGFEEEVIE